VIDGTDFQEAAIFIVKDGTIMSSTCTGAVCACTGSCVACRCSLNGNSFEIDVTSFSEYTLAVPLDSDGDGVSDNFKSTVDNCPTVYNPDQVDSDGDCIGDVCDPDLNDPNNPVTMVDTDGDAIGDSCDNCSTLANPGQEDTYPPGGNSCGNACECEGNFNVDVDVDGGDAAVFKASFGRGGLNRPCTNGDPCNGDFTCDGNVSGSDAALFKSDFGRSGLNNPCPSCVTEPWCVYP
jgi:hypothetical protein